MCAFLDLPSENKNELIESLAEELEVSKRYARNLVDSVFQQITNAANNGQALTVKHHQIARAVIADAG